MGKIDTVLSDHPARPIHARGPRQREVCVHPVACIGPPIDRSWTVGHDLPLDDVHDTVREIVNTDIARLAAFPQALARGEHPVGEAWTP